MFATWRARTRPLVLFVLWLACARAGLAEAPVSSQTLTVDEAVREAIDRNLSLVAERFSVDVAQARIATAALRPNPVVTVNALLPDGDAYDNTVSPREEVFRTDVVIERGGKRERRIEVARSAKSVAELQFLNTMRTLVLDVQHACVDVILAQQNLTLARQSLESFNSLVQINVERVRTGDLARVELSRSRLAALQFQNDVRQQQAKLTVAQNRLKTLLARSDAAPVAITGVLRRDPQPIDRSTVRSLAATLRPDLEALRRDQARSTAELRLQIAQRQIDYTVSGEVHHQQQPVPAPGGASGFLYGVFLSAPLPIFNRNQGEIERARLEERQATARIAALEAQIGDEADAASEACSAARDIVTTIESQMLAEARDVRTTTEYSYRRGEASFIEFLDAVRAFNDTMQSYNAARADYARSLYALDAIAGGRGAQP